MTTPAEHPDDATLFEYVEGTLDAAASTELRAHLARCSACESLVQLAASGTATAPAAVVTMPDGAAQRLDAAVGATWDELYGLAAPMDDAIHPTPLAPPAGISSAPKRPRRRWLDMPRLAPVAAVLLVAIVAVTSLTLDDTGPDLTAPTEDRSTDSAATSADAGFDAPQAGAEAGVAGRELAPGETSSEQIEGAADDASAPPTASPDDPFGGATQPDLDDPALEIVCIATLDATRLFLPDGRPPQQIYQGPFGMYVVCG